MLIDHYNKRISIKIVYFGLALSGKTTSIKALFSHFGKEDEVQSIESTMDRTLFFDYGTMSFRNKDWFLKIHIYTTTGQDFYIVTRPITLRAVDGVIFVIDSQQEVYERNLISWNELTSYFKELIEQLPIIISFNKQDLPDKFNSSEFLEEIKYLEYKYIGAKDTTALNGEGILDSFEDILKLTSKKFEENNLNFRRALKTSI